MGSACQKQQLETSHGDEGLQETIQPVSKEITLPRIHNKHQKNYHKHKLASLSKEVEIKSIHVIEYENHQNQSTQMQRSTQEQSFLQIANEQVKKKEQKPKIINQVLPSSKSKEQIQEQQLRSSLRSISLQHAASTSLIRPRGQSEKHVRFRLPKSSKKNIKSEKQIKRLKTRADNPFQKLDKFNLKSRLLKL